MEKVGGESRLSVVLACVLSVQGAIIGLADTNSAHAVTSARANESDRTLKVLMIGNSFSVQMVSVMPPIARDLGLKLDICSLYIGGCSLERHWMNVCTPTTAPYAVTRNVEGVAQKGFRGNLPAVLAGERWDVVTIQQASHHSWDAATYHPWGDRLVGFIRERQPRAKIVVQETWSYTPWDKRLSQWGMNQNEMYEKLHAAYALFAASHGLDIIPTGTAVQMVRREWPVVYTENSLGGDVVGSATFVRQEDGRWRPKGDVFHMGGDGNYLQALVWTAKLFGVDVTRCGYAPKGMSPARASFLRRMAACSVNP